VASLDVVGDPVLAQAQLAAGKAAAAAPRDKGEDFGREAI
jgi:hypothetical protein